MLEMTPAVFAVENEYQILFPVTHPCFAWVKVGEEIYEDAVNGIRNSQNPIHRVRVSAQALDRAGRYTVCCQPVLERKPYYTETGAVQEFSFPFFPVPRENCRVYHISDAHNRLEEPIRAARAFGEIDALILNGDLLNFSHDLDELKNVFRICDALTKGQLPVIFSRGNHDMRGLYGERLVDYSPLWQGKPYYSFRLGGIWGLVLDCGEDKPDDSPEYGGCVACHGFRREETEFLEQMVARKDYQHPEIHTRLIISHMPFTQRNVPPFDIEQPTYRRWTNLVAQMNPDLILCGHAHVAQIRYPGCQEDAYGQPCPVIIGSGFADQKRIWIGCGIAFSKGKLELTFTDSNGNVIETQRIENDHE